MILMDFSQVMIASLFANIGNHTNTEISEDLIRHMFLNSLRSNRNKFKNEYGELVICCDAKNSWRRDAFPFYKANRRKARAASEINWEELFRIISLIREELSENFPYKVIQIDGCEADDIIGVLCHAYGTELNTGSEKILVLSGDKDYIQLLKYANVDQYDPVRKRFIRHDNPEMYLREHVIRGDAGDGVPNILSADNSLAVGERQKPVTSKRLNIFLQGPAAMDEVTKTRFFRNQMMIDLSQTPEKYRETILSEYTKDKEVGRSKLFNFFIEKRLKHLITDIGDF